MRSPRCPVGTGAVVADDGREIRPALYGPDDALAGELIAAARRLAQQGGGIPPLGRRGRLGSHF
jgi:hypothetical protein